MATEQVQKSRPIWLKWTLRVILSYVALLAILLAVTIIIILITFSFIVIDGVTESRSLGILAEKYLVPVSEFFWKLFTWGIPGI